ncbi:sterile alpha motif domain-containing protein 12-like [Myripristis murdjan]|uniref:sterile alpha motif domain-containing protein 12-like n=1 Tax=Myripristis murdjan TaxID=586833 RepID=UPI0011761DF6|nr:sterile alpha motif domain-containing protein 12-like [Myripristis murdjan]
MGLSKRVSFWSVEEVLDWVQEYYPAQLNTLHTAFIKHSITGRALLRMKEHHLERLGVESKEQQEILQDVLLLRVQEELENLNDIYAECFSS